MKMIHQLCRKKAGFSIPCFLCLCARCQGRARGSAPDPTRHPDPRHPDPTPDPTPRHPDPKRKVRGLQADARGCKGGKAYASGCKGMQAKKQGGRGQGGGARDKGVANLAKRRKRSKPWRLSVGVSLSVVV